MPAVSEEKAKTLGEVDSENKGKKTKVPKETKAPKRKRPKRPKGSKGKNKNRPQAADETNELDGIRKSHGTRNSIIITNVIWILIVLVFIAMFRLGRRDEEGYYHYIIDPGGIVRGPVLLFLNPEELSREEYYSQDYDMLRSWEQDLTEQEEELEKKTTELDDREINIEDRDSALAEKESQVEELLAQLKENMPQGSGETFDIKTIAQMVQSMTPVKAAAMLAAMSDDATVINILNALGKKASPILDVMDPEISAPLIEGMIPEPADEIDLGDYQLP